MDAALSAELRVRHKDGSWRSFEGKAKNPLKHPAVRGIVVSSRDFTERKQAQEALETRVIEQQVLFRLPQTLLASLDPEAIAQASFEVIGEHFQPDGIGLYVPDASGTHLEMTAAQGWMREQMDHLRVPLQPPEISGAAWAVHTRAPVRGDHTRPDRPFAGPEVARRAGVKACLHAPMLTQQRVVGVLSLMSLTPRTYSDEDVRFLSLIANQAGIALDRARAHQAAREAETRHRILFESIPVGLYHSTPEGRILDANPTLVGMLGYPDRETLRAVNAADLYADPEVHARWQEVMEREGVVRNFEAQLRRRDGSIIWVEVNARSVLDAEGRVMSHEGSVQDITERKRAAEEQQRLLERVRAGRERLQTLSRRLLEAQEAERRFIARELHDEVGQALTAVKLNLQEAQRLAGSSAITPSLDESIGIVNRILQQVRDLSLDLRPSMLDDLGLVAALRWYVDRHAQRATFTAQFLAEPTEIQTPADIATTCFRVAQEALTNAARHARAQSVRVEVRQHATELELVIGDDGVGSDVEAARERAAAGASLGLLGMQERVILAGGQIDIKSAPTRGTEIRVRFPHVSPLSHGRRVERRSARRGPP